MNRPTKHHYVPKLLLKGFTKALVVDDTLWICDIKLRRAWDRSPESAAIERNFYRWENSGTLDPMWLERLLGDKVEPRMAEALKQSIQNLAVSDDEEMRTHFLTLVASSVIRGPAMRAMNSDSFNSGIQELIAEWLKPENYQGQFKDLLSATGKSVEELREMNQQGVFQYDVDKNTHLQAIIDQAIHLVGIFSRRRWVVLPLSDDAPDLICSDSPVGLLPLKGYSGLSWLDPNTLVTFPLNRRTLALGLANDYKYPDKVFPRFVASVNRVTGAGATQVYSSEPRFFWVSSEGKYHWVEFSKEAVEASS